jgi:hypothetical protein
MSFLVVSLLLGTIFWLTPVDVLSSRNGVRAETFAPASVVVLSEVNPKNNEIRNSNERRFEDRDPVLLITRRRPMIRLLEAFSPSRFWVTGCYRGGILGRAIEGTAHTTWTQNCLELIQAVEFQGR